MIYQEIIKKNRLASKQISADELPILLRELEIQLLSGKEGDIVEMGCYEGTSALFFQRLIERTKSDKKLWLYDSFEGLPKKVDQDTSVNGELFVEGALKASQAQLKRNFTKAGLKIPEIKKAWFWELDPSDLPEHICFAFLDGDFYESIRDSLRLVWQRMSEGGVIIIDDYGNVRLPGARKAVDEFVYAQNIEIGEVKSLAILNA